MNSTQMKLPPLPLVTRTLFECSSHEDALVVCRSGKEMRRPPLVPSSFRSQLSISHVEQLLSSLLLRFSQFRHEVM